MDLEGVVHNGVIVPDDATALPKGTRVRITLAPPGANVSDYEATFRSLADQWRSETDMYSSISKKLQHPAYRTIIAMGERVVPLILRELRDRPGHWFEALKAITKQTPVPADDRANASRAREWWLNWGRERGVL